MFRATVSMVALLALTGCANVFYAETPTGKFSGKLTVEWIAPNQFIYRPDPAHPLTFVTADGASIQPRLMYTDGGSIPRLFWSSPNLGPWDFAPGYIIHDWLFKQHHCREDDWQRFDFERTAAVLAEAIKTQMKIGGEDDPTVMWAIYEAVRTPVARRLWDNGPCKEPPAAMLWSAPADRRPVPILTIDLP